MEMLSEFYIGFPLFILSLFGVLEVSELSYFQSTAEFASFSAARSHFVDDDGEGFAKKASKSAVTSVLHPLQLQTTKNTTLQLDTTSKIAEVTLNDLLLVSFIRISGKTPLAEKNGDTSK